MNMLLLGDRKLVSNWLATYPKVHPHPKEYGPQRKMFATTLKEAATKYSAAFMDQYSVAFFKFLQLNVEVVNWHNWHLVLKIHYC